MTVHKYVLRMPHITEIYYLNNFSQPQRICFRDFIFHKIIVLQILHTSSHKYMVESLGLCLRGCHRKLSLLQREGAKEDSQYTKEYASDSHATDPNLFLGKRDLNWFPNGGGMMPIYNCFLVR